MWFTRTARPGRHSLAVLATALIGWLLLPAVAGASSLAWRPADFMPQNKKLWGVGYGAGTFVAAGESGAILTSSDGATWSLRKSGTKSFLTGVVYGGGQWVVVGDNGTVLTSADGVAWKGRYSGTTRWLKGVTYAKGMYVAVGRNGAIITSADGAKWTERRSGTSSFLKSVVYGAVYGADGGGRFVVTGEEGVILTSSDGINWTKQDSGTDYWIPAVTYANGLFVVVGENGTILTSPDGLHWTFRRSGTDDFLSGVAYAGGRFVAVGENGTILTSPDGVTWTPEISGTADWLRAVTYGGDRFVAVSDSGMSITTGGFASGTGKINVTPLDEAAVDKILKEITLPAGFTSIGRGYVYTVEGGTEARPVTMAVSLPGGLPGGIDRARIGLFRVEDDGELKFVSGRWDTDRLIIALPKPGTYVLAEKRVGFADMNRHWARDAVELMAAKNVARGMGGSFHPDAHVTRAEFAAWLVRAMGLPAAEKSVAFTDVGRDDWFYPELMTAVDAGIIKGFSDGSFRPNAPVTREEVAVMLARALRSAGREVPDRETVNRRLELYDDGAAVSSWARADLVLALSEQIMFGKTESTLQPKAGATRAEAMVMIARFWGKQ